jgi:hypothetical protein
VKEDVPAHAQPYAIFSGEQNLRLQSVDKDLYADSVPSTQLMHPVGRRSAYGHVAVDARPPHSLKPSRLEWLRCDPNFLSPLAWGHARSTLCVQLRGTAALS